MRFPVVVTGVTMFSAEQCPAAPEDDGPEKGRLSLSRPSRLLVMTMCLNYEVREVCEKALPRSSDVQSVLLHTERSITVSLLGPADQHWRRRWHR